MQRNLPRLALGACGVRTVLVAIYTNKMRVDCEVRLERSQRSPSAWLKAPFKSTLNENPLSKTCAACWYKENNKKNRNKTRSLAANLNA